MLKKILIFIGALIALLLVLAIFLPSNYRVERSATINAPVEDVYNQVADFNNYAKWNPWSKMDPEAKITVSENSSGVGANWSWEGEEIGTGSLTIEKAEEYKSIETKLVFTAPRQDEGIGFWTFEETDGKTKVTWAMEGELGYPIGRFMGLMMEGMLGESFEQGLNNIKEIVEK
jgi:ribosome-associated toxin RatA of RatAB toxin-antitoxin module